MSRMDCTIASLLLFMLIRTGLSLDKDLSCAVCRAVVDEVNYSISKVDPKKKIQVGSFRVDSKGNQGTYEKPYARSEVHLLEIFETVCDSFKNYAETTNIAGKKSIARTEARDGKTLSLSNIKISAETGKQLKHRCESLIEEFEDEMIAVFRKDSVIDVDYFLCVEATKQCTTEDIVIPMPQTEYSDKDAMIQAEKEKLQSNSDEIDEELIESFISDSSDTTEDIPADKVIEQNIQIDASTTAGDSEKEEL